MVKIDERTTLPLGLVVAILSVVIVGVAGGAAWATRSDIRSEQADLIMKQLQEDMAITKNDVAQIKSRLGIVTSSR